MNARHATTCTAHRHTTWHDTHVHENARGVWGVQPTPGRWLVESEGERVSLALCCHLDMRLIVTCSGSERSSGTHTWGGACGTKRVKDAFKVS